MTPTTTGRALEEEVGRLLDGKTKPVGSLGRIEQLALQIALALGTPAPRLQAPQMVVFAADHGIAAQGVSAYPSDVTWQMVENFLAGGAALAWPLLESACRILAEMASFESAGVSTRGQ